MGEALAAQNRDIVFSLCNYGKGNVSTWGENVGGQMWRTGGDIKDSFKKMVEDLEKQSGFWPYAHPGAWNDPDMRAPRSKVNARSESKRKKVNSERSGSRVGPCGCFAVRALRSPNPTPSYPPADRPSAKRMP